jgi:hypothetical protein
MPPLLKLLELALECRLLKRSLYRGTSSRRARRATNRDDLTSRSNIGTIVAKRRSLELAQTS